MITWLSQNPLILLRINIDLEKCVYVCVCINKGFIRLLRSIFILKMKVFLIVFLLELVDILHFYVRV